eukprot:scaffold47648_cov33-Tisochrysis_lutea.AAC.1
MSACAGSSWHQTSGLAGDDRGAALDQCRDLARTHHTGEWHEQRHFKRDNGAEGGEAQAADNCADRPRVRPQVGHHELGACRNCDHAECHAVHRRDHHQQLPGECELERDASKETDSDGG